MKTVVCIISLVAAGTLFANGQGTILWDESVNGPLSNSVDAPSSLQPVIAGTNTILATVQVTPQGAGWVASDDLFFFTVPTGLQVTSINFTVNGVAAAWLGNSGFGVEYGYVVTSSNGDLLPKWGIGSLTSGAYGMYVGDRDIESFPTMVNYRVDFFAQSIPEPGAISLLLLGAGFIGLRRWKRLN